MDTYNLKIYLNRIRELEQSCYTLQESINKLQYKASGLGISTSYTEPARYNMLNEFIEEDDASKVFIFSVIIAVISFLVELNKEFKNNIWIDYIFNSFRCIIKYGIKILLITAIAALIFGALLCLIRYTNFKKEYKVKYEEYLQKTSDNFKRVEKEKNIQKNIYVQINSLKAVHKETRTLLDQLYSYEIIYPKYRGMIPITMFYEYLESGRCTQLKGHEGAYNIYENEIRQNLIITELRKIQSQLESIRQTQYMLYSELVEGNNIAQKILECAQSTEINSEVTRYNSAVTAKNTEIAAEQIAMQNIYIGLSRM